MEDKQKLNFVKDGVMNLPPGFRFQPTEEEIVFQYLARKITSCPLPASIIPEITNVCQFNPWDLPGDLEQDRYFFSKEEANVNRKKSVTGAGYWVSTGLDKKIIGSRSRKNLIMGMKKTLAFYQWKPAHGWSATNWIMHEYRLVHSGNANSSMDQNSLIQMGNWVLCHLFFKKRCSKIEKGSIEDFTSVGIGEPRFYGYTTNSRDYSTCSSSSCCCSFSDSSIITKVSSNELDQEETSGFKF